MQEEKIDKAILNASSNVECEPSSTQTFELSPVMTKQELMALRKALIKEGDNKSTIFQLVEAVKKQK